MSKTSPVHRRLLRAKRPNQLADIDELLATMLGPPPQSIRDARVELDLVRSKFSLVISLVTREHRAMLSLDETEMMLDLLLEHAGDIAAVRSPVTFTADGTPARAVSVKEARGMVTTVALQLGQDPNVFWLELIEGLLHEDRKLVEDINRLARVQPAFAGRGPAEAPAEGRNSSSRGSDDSLR